VPELPARNHCESIFEDGKLIHTLKTNTDITITIGWFISSRKNEG
jgi:hypothetical protein